MPPKSGDVLSKAVTDMNGITTAKMSTDLKSLNPKQLQQRIDAQLASNVDERVLLDELDRLSRHPSFDGFTWQWAPVLYARNPMLFRAFILRHFAAWQVRGWRFEAVKWRQHAKELDPWLRQVDQNDDVALFKRLYQWKFQDELTGIGAPKQVQAELERRFAAAGTPAQRLLVLNKFDFWFKLSETAACALYRIDPQSSRDFIFHLIDRSKFWDELYGLALKHQDDGFARRIYRAQANEKRWLHDLEHWLREAADGKELLQVLEDHHPQRWDITLGRGYLAILEARGREALPYVMRHVERLRHWRPSKDYFDELLALAERQGWHDLWSALLRSCANPKEFNKALRELLNRDDATALQRLRMLAGVAQEWNWPGFGLARVNPLEAETALLFHRRQADLLRGPFKTHLHAISNAEKFLRHLLHENDAVLLDFIASRVVTRLSWFKAGKEVTLLADYYEKLKATGEFPSRATAVLTQIPAFTIYDYHRLIRENRLARLLFERDLASYLDTPGGLTDLVEADEIHVQLLAYRVLSLDDERARQAAEQHLNILLGTLLRPLHSKTRSHAFNALYNAARSEPSAARILHKCREAMDLPDRHYPKEKLLGLMGRLLLRWPNLRTPQEQPTVYRREAAAA